MFYCHPQEFLVFIRTRRARICGMEVNGAPPAAARFQQPQQKIAVHTQPPYIFVLCMLETFRIYTTTARCMVDTLLKIYILFVRPIERALLCVCVFGLSCAVRRTTTVRFLLLPPLQTDTIILNNKRVNICKWNVVDINYCKTFWISFWFSCAKENLCVDKIIL